MYDHEDHGENDLKKTIQQVSAKVALVWRYLRKNSRHPIDVLWR